MKIIQNKFFCTECGKEGISVIRQENRQREIGHLKKLYCLNCKKETNHAEIREMEGYSQQDFQQEYELGRFVDGRRIGIKKLSLCTNLKCKYNINKNCWNANKTFRCSHRRYDNKKEVSNESI